MAFYGIFYMFMNFYVFVSIFGVIVLLIGSGGTIVKPEIPYFDRMDSSQEHLLSLLAVWFENRIYPIQPIRLFMYTDLSGRGVRGQG